MYTEAWPIKALKHRKKDHLPRKEVHLFEGLASTSGEWGSVTYFHRDDHETLEEILEEILL